MTKQTSYARPQNQSLKATYDHYILMAEAAVDKKEREQWRVLADEIGRRIGLVDPEPTVQGELFGRDECKSVYHPPRRD